MIGQSKSSHLKNYQYQERSSVVKTIRVICKKTFRQFKAPILVTFCLAIIALAIFPSVSSAQDKIPEYFGIFFSGKGELTEFDTPVETVWLKSRPGIVQSRTNWNPLKVSIEGDGSIIVYDQQYNTQKFKLLEYMGSAVQDGDIFFQTDSVEVRIGPVAGAPASCYRLAPKNGFEGKDYLLVYEPKKGEIEKAWQFAVYRDPKINPIREEIVSLTTTFDGYPSVWAGTPGGLFAKLENRWEFREVRGFTPKLIACDPAQSDALYVVFNAEGLAIHRTPDGGKTWVKLAIPSTLKANLVVAYQPKRIHTITISPADSKRIFVGAEGISGLGGKTSGMIILSEDGGVKWKIIKSDCPVPKTIRFNPVNPEIVFAGTGSEIHRSDNGGEKWKEIKGSPKGVTVMGIDPTGTTMIVWSPFGPFRSLDGGNTWEKLSGWQYGIHAPFTGIEFLQSSDGGSTVFVTCKEGVFMSNDNGISWEKRNQGMQDNIAVAIATHKNHGTLYVATSSGIYSSSDNGQNWKSE